MRNFTATVKEREVGQPCYVALELKSDIGLPANKWVTLHLPEGTHERRQRGSANHILKKIRGSNRR